MRIIRVEFNISQFIKVSDLDVNLGKKHNKWVTAICQQEWGSQCLEFNMEKIWNVLLSFKAWKSFSQTPSHLILLCSAMLLWYSCLYLKIHRNINSGVKNFNWQENGSYKFHPHTWEPSRSTMGVYYRDLLTTFQLKYSRFHNFH